ncbi:MAG: hypothetical protein ABF335_06660 [Alphaproteobacteria bacterium]
MSEAVIGFLGVIVGGLIGIAGQLGNNWSNRRKSAKFLAIRIICLLDTYAQLCVDVVQDDGSVYGGPAGYTPHGQEIYEPQVDAPAAPAYSEDIDWQSIPADLAYQLLEFPNTVWETERYVSAVADNDSPPYDDFLRLVKAVTLFWGNQPFKWRTNCAGTTICRRKQTPIGIKVGISVPFLRVR